MDALGMKIDAIKTARAKIDKYFDGRNSIDRLMRDKVDDYVLLEEMPMAVQIGDKTMYVGNFTVENQYKFFREYPKILGNLGLQCVNFDMIGNAGELYQRMMLHKRLFKDLCRLIKRTILSQQDYYYNQGAVKYKIPKISLRYFRKNVSVEKLIQICFLVYLYNFDAVKKNLKIVMERMDASNTSGTYMYGWLQNLAGLEGKFLLSLLTNSGSSSNDCVIAVEEALTKPARNK
jgi:hypothetical protein